MAVISLNEAPLPAGLDSLSGYAIILGIAGIYYVVPYLLIAGYLYWRLPRWSFSHQLRALWLTPALVSFCVAAAFAGYQVLQGSTQWWDGAGTIFGLGLLIGYAYAVAIAFIERWTRAARHGEAATDVASADPASA
jgi:hypothetical protein